MKNNAQNEWNANCDTRSRSLWTLVMRADAYWKIAKNEKQTADHWCQRRHCGTAYTSDNSVIDFSENQISIEPQNNNFARQFQMYANVCSVDTRIVRSFSFTLSHAHTHTRAQMKSRALWKLKTADTHTNAHSRTRIRKSPYIRAIENYYCNWVGIDKSEDKRIEKTKSPINAAIVHLSTENENHSNANKP